ncbi:hypothetical protein [Parashewanella tropica]|uniref:hypothetical protein n=1 Tax=Parashewanella tropica TaxID=2547970 RepID=UPI00105A6C8B|nr:hypothetical protein [Parashewanella tropica]
MASSEVQAQVAPTKYLFRLGNAFTTPALSMFSFIEETDTCCVSFTTESGNEVVFTVLIDKSDPNHQPYLAKFFAVADVSEIPHVLSRKPTFIVTSSISSFNRTIVEPKPDDKFRYIVRAHFRPSLPISDEETSQICSIFHQLPQQQRATLELSSLVKDGKWDLIQTQIERGVDLNYPVRSSKDFIASMIEQYPNSQKVLYLMLQNGMNPFFINENGTSIFHYVINRDHAGLLSTLLGFNEEFNGLNLQAERLIALQSHSSAEPRGTPLTIAMRKGLISTVGAILSCCPQTLSVYKNWEEITRALPFWFFGDKKNRLATVVRPYWQHFQIPRLVPKRITHVNSSQVLYTARVCVLPNEELYTPDGESDEETYVCIKNNYDTRSVISKHEDITKGDET